MKILLTFLTALSMTINPVAGAASEEEVLTQMLNEFLAGASVNDAAAHERFWDDDLVYTSSKGLRYGKADILAGLNSGEETAAEEPPVVYSAEDIRIRIYGDTAVVAFRLLGTVQGDPAELLQYFNTGTFVNRVGEWRAVAWQATVIPQAE
jgi:hypothetical protein